MKTEINPLKYRFVAAQNEQSPRFISTGIHTKGDVDNLHRNEYEKDPNVSKYQNQGRKKGEEI